MNHRTYKSLIIEQVENMRDAGCEFTSYDIKSAIPRDIDIRMVAGVIKGVPGVVKVRNHSRQQVTVWKAEHV